MDAGTKQYMEGDKVTCPNCGGMEFCIGKDDIWTEGEPYADCINCQTSTLVELLKTKYHEDKAKDFTLTDVEDITIGYDCGECGKYYKTGRRFKLKHYFGTMYDEFEPELEEWKCDQHPKGRVNMFIGASE